MEDPKKYAKIDKILEEVDMPYLDWSEEDNRIKSRFFHLKDTIEMI